MPNITGLQAADAWLPIPSAVQRQITHLEIQSLIIAWEIKVNKKRGHGINSCMSCENLQLGLWISANSIQNINTAKSLQKNRKQFASRRKGYPQLEPGSCLGYTPILTHLFLLTNLFIIPLHVWCIILIDEKAYRNFP